MYYTSDNNYSLSFTNEVCIYFSVHTCSLSANSMRVWTRLYIPKTVGPTAIIEHRSCAAKNFLRPLSSHT